MRPASNRRPNLFRYLLLFAALALTAAWLLTRAELPRSAAQATLPPYRNFEAPQVHPLALTPDGARLLAVNSPNGTLSVFHLTSNVQTLIKEIPVGLEPVSVAARTDTEAWVTNWLSDSVSVVNLVTGNVTRTIDVGDEPTDVLFAGTQNEKAFVCVSGIAQVKVFDVNQPTAAPQVINIRGKQPRALTRSSDGARVFVSIFESGNQTTIVPANQVSLNGGAPPPTPSLAPGLPAPPNNGLIVKWNGSRWADERGDTRWSNVLPYTLADVDVVVLDARTPAVSAELRGIGTNVGNAAFDAANNKLYVANLEAHNEVRFEPNVRGKFQTSRVSIINFGSGTTTPADLNTHINQSNAAGSDAERALSLAMPADIKRAADGTLYVAATSSAKVGVLDASGAVQTRISVGQGPTGLALDEARSRLYVLNRFDETVSVVDTSARTELGRISIGVNPEPQAVRQGRRFLYDASLSAHGDLSCASCHLNGHRDGLAWDLGDPQGTMQFVQNPLGNVAGIPLLPSNFHPMKGPMTTQSLRGITGTEPLHWRGDRAAIDSFNPAFVSLLGGTRQLTADEMASFAAFVQTLTYPPNPLENLDRSLPNPATGPNPTRGRQLFNNARLDASTLTCNQCHTAGPGGTGTNRAIIPGILLQESQDVKVPQLRGLYQKLGLRNAPGEQLTGYGFIHDGSFDTLLNFLRSPVFTFVNDADRLDVAQFVLSFDTGTAPAVGLQVTVGGDNKTSTAVIDRINLLMTQADARDCDLVVKGMWNGVPRGFLYAGGGLFQPDKQADASVTWQTLVQTADFGKELTFTGVPVGAGRRFGIDSNGDGVLNGDVAASNAIDSSPFFVTQHYLDFLNREPDAGGLSYWTEQITQCGTDINCINQRRVGVSAAYFIETEFQETGYYVYRIYKASLGRRPNFAEFMADRALINPAQIEASKQQFADAWVQRAAFLQAYPSTSPAEFVNKLYDTAGLTNNTAERDAQISALQSGQKTRARVLRDVADNQSFSDREYNGAFVAMQYFGYLRRDPEDGGYLFWLDVLNNKVPGNYRSMVCAFLTSAEYQLRFGNVATHSNQECK